MAKAASTINGMTPQDPNLRDVQESMLDGLGQLAAYFGFSKVMGQLYGALLMSPEPLSLDDLVELLDISKASVSMNLRTLEQLGMVRQVWVRGKAGRRKFYESETDFWQIISNILSRREMRDVERAINVMDENTERLSKALPDMLAEDQELAQLYLERIGQMQSLFRFAQLIITSILAKSGEMDFNDVSRIEIE
ncbi:MAG: helix-turn-helix domain-containing protein [Anaerolineae bacterium]|nr:helix-turn-helix domain-containing protein [Anaerolineae bacterium]